MVYQDASALQLAYREAALAVPFAADVVPEASGASAKTLAANEPGALAAPPLLPKGGGAVHDTHTVRRTSRVSAKDITGNKQSAPHAKVYAKEVIARSSIGVGSRVQDSEGTRGVIVARSKAWLTMRTDAGVELVSFDSVSITLGRGVWKKSAVDIMAMLKAMKDGEGVCLAAEFFALPDRSEYPGAACCLP